MRGTTTTARGPVPRPRKTRSRRPSGRRDSQKRWTSHGGPVSDDNGGLTDMRNRMYDPTLGTFISRDPLESTTHEAYRYVGGNPISRVDPTGLASERPRRRQYAPVGPDFCWSSGYCPFAEGNHAWETAPPGTTVVRCSALMGCRAYVGGIAYTCPGGDCGYGPPPVAPSGGSGGGFGEFLRDLGGAIMVVATLVEGCVTAVGAGQAFIVYTSGLGPEAPLIAAGALCVGGAGLAYVDPNPPGFGP